MQHEVTATCSTHSSWQKSFNFEIKLEKRRFTFFSKEIFLAQSQWEGEDGAILVGQVYFGLWEMVRTMFLQFFIWLTDGEGGRWGQRGRRKKEEDWGWKRREIEGTGAHPPCIMLNSKGLVTEWEGRRPRVHRCSARRGCTFTGRKKIQSAESTGERVGLQNILNVPSASKICICDSFNSRMRLRGERRKSSAAWKYSLTFTVTFGSAYIWK